MTLEGIDKHMTKKVLIDLEDILVLKGKTSLLQAFERLSLHGWSNIATRDAELLIEGYELFFENLLRWFD
jgi:hypothetical protein